VEWSGGKDDRAGGARTPVQRCLFSLVTGLKLQFA
jgi:hypothetical protein